MSTPESAGKGRVREADIEDMFDAIDTAEADAESLHGAGRCHESEWSCSYCEKSPFPGNQDVPLAAEQVHFRTEVPHEHDALRDGLTLLLADLKKAEPHQFSIGLMCVRIKHLLSGGSGE